MSLALYLLALVAVFCMFAHAEQASSPNAKSMEKMLNGVQNNLLSDTLQQDLDASDFAEAEKFDDALQAVNAPGAQWAENDEHSFASIENTMEADMDLTGSFSKKKHADKPAAVPQNPYSAALAKFFGGTVSKPSTVLNKKGAVVESLRMTTGAVGSVNSHCFTCQYYLQRTLGALLGPFYHPLAAGPPAPMFKAPELPFAPTATPLARWSQPTVTSSAHDVIGARPEGEFPRSEIILAEVDAEVEAEAEAEEDVSFLEISSLVKRAFPTPSAEEALEQYNKWKSFLPDHMSLIEVEGAPVKNRASRKLGDSIVKNGAPKGAHRFKHDPKKATEELAEQNAKAAAARKARLQRKALRAQFRAGLSVKSNLGKMYGKVEMGAIRTFFSHLCHRRTPTEFMPTCRGIFKKLDLIVEELAVGDRPDEVCIRHNFCPANSYVANRAHSAVRALDI